MHWNIIISPGFVDKYCAPDMGVVKAVVLIAAQHYRRKLLHEHRWRNALVHRKKFYDDICCRPRHFSRNGASRRRVSGLKRVSRLRVFSPLVSAVERDSGKGLGNQRKPQGQTTVNHTAAAQFSAPVSNTNSRLIRPRPE